MPTISVVMPAYNAAEFISAAFDSLIAQTLTDWECVVVNDGSTDHTLSVIEEYATQDTRIRYTSIENTGSAKIPRDIAVGMTKSELIVALDADDFLSPDTLQHLVERQTQTNADIVYLKMELFCDITGDILTTIPKSGFDYRQVVSGREALMMTIGDWIIGANGAIKRDILVKRTQYKNNTICHMNADEYDTREILSIAQKVAFVDTKYHYRIRAASITHNVSPRLFETVITDRMVSELVGREFGVDSAEYRKSQAIALKSVLNKYVMWVRYARAFSAEERKQVYLLIQTERKRYSLTDIWSSKITFIRKILLISPLWVSLLPIIFFIAIQSKRK